MKTLYVIALGSLALGGCQAALAANLELHFEPRFNGAPLVFDSLANQTAAGQSISVTRLDFLVSNVALHRANGQWQAPSNQFGFISAAGGRTSFTVNDVPAGNFDALRFQIGVSPIINHTDAAKWPGGHPLNSEVNHLYWGWQREYVFLAFEGAWQSGAKQSGFSYHLAGDRQLMMVELPVELNTSSDNDVQLGIDVDKILSGAKPILLTDATDTTHSRTNDALATVLHDNVQRAISVVGQAPRISEPAKIGGTSAVRLVGPGATPYRFMMSKFFPQPDLPKDNPLTVEGVALGRRLFFDRQLSLDNSESCARCHRPRNGLTENRRFSVGINGEFGTRNSMPLENLAWKKEFFWDGRAASLREQVLQPIQNPIEMHQPLEVLMRKLSVDPTYHAMFARAFGSPEITSDRLARALEQFLLVQVSYESKFDRVASGKASFTPDEQRGFQLFHTEYDPYHGQSGADCFHCHGGPLFQSQSFANNGLDSSFRDEGRFVVTHREGDRGKFAVPSLRNVAVTGPYMHDGRFRTLEEVVEHYCTGMKRSATLDPNLAKHPDGGLPLSASDKQALVAFLRTLTDDRFIRPTAVVSAGQP